VHHVRRRGSDPRLVVLLFGVERAPLRPAVDLVLLDDEPAVDTDGLAVFRVGRELAAALWTSQLFLLAFRLGLALVVDVLGRVRSKVLAHWFCAGGKDETEGRISVFSSPSGK